MKTKIIPALLLTAAILVLAGCEKAEPNTESPQALLTSATESTAKHKTVGMNGEIESEAPAEKEESEAVPTEDAPNTTIAPTEPDAPPTPQTPTESEPAVSDPPQTEPPKTEPDKPVTETPKQEEPTPTQPSKPEPTEPVTEPPKQTEPPKTEPPVTTEPPKPTEPPITEEPPAPEEPEPPKEPTQADFDRIIAEVRAYAESYRDKGFTFEWDDTMEFSWDVGWFGTPRIRYEGIDGTIEMLKYHVDKIYKTSTDPKYGLTSDRMPYKVVQITVDGDIAFAVIYGG